MRWIIRNLFNYKITSDTVGYIKMNSNIRIKLQQLYQPSSINKITMAVED